MITTLILPIAKNDFVADAVATRLRSEMGIAAAVRFDPRACGVEVEDLAPGVEPALLLREAGLTLELAEAAMLYRVDGEGQCAVYVRTARARDFGATSQELTAFHELLEDALALWARASGFKRAELHVLQATALTMSDVRPTLIPLARALRDGRPLLEQAADHPVCPDAEEALLALERAVWGEVACRQAAA